jgi:TonB family protein
MEDLDDSPIAPPNAPSDAPTDVDGDAHAPGSHEESTSDIHPSLAMAVAAHRSIFRPVPRRRFFGIPLVGGISLATSICAHAAVIGIGFAVYRHFRPPPPVLAFALGDASQTRNELFWKEQTPGGTGMPQLSEIDPSQVPPNSSAAVMRQLAANHDADLPTNHLASTYVGPRPLWADAPLVGARDNAAQLGTLATHRASAPGSAAANPSAPPAQSTQGTGKGSAVGAESGNANTGRAGVTTGRPDISGLPKPDYPEESIRRREEGTVMVSITVLKDGSVGDIAVVSTPPFPRLTRKAVDAVRQVHFDRAYAGWVITIPYEFKLP